MMKAHRQAKYWIIGCAGLFVMTLLVPFAYTAHAQEGDKVFRDISYMQPANPDTSLDIYTPSTSGKRPVVIFVHGGAWTFGDKRAVAVKPLAFAQAGYVFVSINYRLVPTIQFPENVKDVARAIAWTAKNIGQYGGDPARIFLIGHSAGAHLVALVATDDRYLKEQGLSLSAIKGVVPLDGAGYDIPRTVENGRFMERRLYQRAFGTDAKVWKTASPVTYVAPNKGIAPFLLVYAGMRISSDEQSEWLEAALKQANVPVTRFHATNKNHMTVNRDLGKPDDEVTQQVLAFFGKVGGAG